MADAELARHPANQLAKLLAELQTNHAKTN